MCVAEALHAFSQLVYLDSVPKMKRAGRVSVLSLCEYYLRDPIGQAYLRVRFSGIKREMEKWPPFLEKCATLYGDYEITDVLDDNRSDLSGFYGCCFRSPEGGAAIAFRGSEMLGDRRYKNDYISNFGLAYLEKTPQQRMVERYLEALSPEEGALCFTGHSLGGNLAVYGAVMAPERIFARIERCVAFNAPGFGARFVAEAGARVDALGERLVLVQNEFDPISSLLIAPKEPLVAKSRFDPGAQQGIIAEDLVYPHSNFMLQFDASGEPQRNVSGRKSRFCQIIHEISMLILHLPDEAKREISGLLLDLLYLPIGEAQARYHMEALLGEISHLEGEGALSQALRLLLSILRNIEKRDGAQGFYRLLGERAQEMDIRAMAWSLAALSGGAG